MAAALPENETSMLDSKEKLERFCFIGSFVPTLFKRRESIKVEDFYEELEGFIHEVSLKNFVSVIKKCASFEGVRKDEIFLSIYVFMFHPKIPGCDKIKLREVFPEVAITAKDLFLFMKIVKLCSASKKKKLFSKINKKMIEHWYRSQTSNTLAEIFCSQKVYYGFSHSDIFRIFHIPDDVIDNPVIAQMLFKPNAQIEETKKANKKILCIRRVFNESALDEEIQPMLQHLSFENIPKTMLKREYIWVTLLDKLEALKLIRLISTLISEDFFKNQFRSLLKPTFDKCVEKIQEMFVENESRAVDQKVNIHPSTILFILKTLLFYMSNGDVLARKKKRSKTKKTSNEKTKEAEVKKEVKFEAEHEKVILIMETACRNYKGDGLRIFSTFQLTYKYHADFIRTSEYKVMEYLSAFSLVYPYTRCSKNNVCFMFGKMDNLTSLPMDDGFEAEKEKIRKMYENWTEKGESKCHLPIKKAFSTKKCYDLFVTVVRYTSLCTKVQPLIALFKKYREHKNSNAKMVIINMRLKSPGLKFQKSKNEGILELCHFDADTPNIIRAFALNYFN